MMCSCDLTVVLMLLSVLMTVVFLYYLFLSSRRQTNNWIYSNISRFDFYLKFKKDNKDLATYSREFFRPTLQHQSPLFKGVFHQNEIPRWNYLRKNLMRHVLSPSRVNSLVPTIQNCASECLIDQPGHAVDAVELARRYVSLVFYKCCFQLASDEYGRFVDWMKNVRNEESSAMKHVDGITTIAKDCELFLLQLLNSNEEGNNFASYIKDCFPGDKEAVISSLASFALGGFTSTVSTIIFGMYEIAKNRNVQQKLRNSNNRVYMHYFFKEVLRMYPPFAALVKKNCEVSVCGLHYDPKLFPAPDCFRPERFEDSHLKNDNYCPFGYRNRRCIGDHLASSIFYEFVTCLLNSTADIRLARPEEALEFSKNKFTTTVDKLMVKLMR